MVVAIKVENVKVPHAVIVILRRLITLAPRAASSAYTLSTPFTNTFG